MASATPTTPTTSTTSRPTTPRLPISESAAHAAATTQPIAERAHTTLVNALTTPTVDALHDHERAPVNVVISDPVSFAAKRAAMVKGGHTALQVIADFDRTLSAFLTRSGAMCAASHELLENCVGFNASTFRPAMDAINKKYFALEISHDLTTEERAAHMIDWWTKAHDLIIAHNVRREAIDEAVARARKEGRLELRQGAREFLHRLNALDIPCLVFSAGVRETISATLNQEELMLPCMHLIGNVMQFDETGLLKSFNDDTITSSNKNYSHVLTMMPEYHAASAQRKNVIAVGDNIGDANMAQGLDGIENIIRIGLLHDNVEGRIEQFKAAFDIVLLNDADFSFTQKLVEDIINGANGQQ